MPRDYFVQRFGPPAVSADSLPRGAMLRTLACALLAFVVFTASPAWAQIYRWNTGQVIPGTQGITPGPGVDLSGWNAPGHQLEFADLGGTDLTNASFGNSDLNNAYFYYSTLTNANFSGAIVKGANFDGPGLTASQLYSTATYMSGDLTGIGLESNDLTGLNFASQNLTNADLAASTLANANFSGAIVKGTDFGNTTSYGFTASQLDSTASYASRDLTGITLWGNDLSNWNFANQNLTNASFGGVFGGSNLTNANFTNTNLTKASFYSKPSPGGSTLTNANFSGAIVKEANFERTFGFTASQLYSTASYASRDLTGIVLEDNTLTGWNFANQNLTGADFYNTSATNATFTNANLTNANFSSSLLTNADFSGADLRGANWYPAPSTITHNTILPDGSIQGLALLAGEMLVIRNNPTVITVTTSATFDNAAMLEFLLDAGWTSPVGFTPGLTPTLGGTLDLEFAKDFDPASLVGQSFQLFDWNGLLPANDQFAMITTEPGLTFDLSNLYSTGAVALTGVPEPSSLVLGLLALGALPLLARRRKRGS